MPVFAVCGFGLGLGWTFANIATQEVVGTDWPSEASGVVLTFLVTFGGIGLAAAASIISALEHAGRSSGGAYKTTLLVLAFLSLGASLIVMVIRQILVRRGLMKPLSMAADRAADPDAAGR